MSESKYQQIIGTELEWSIAAKYSDKNSYEQLRPGDAADILKEHLQEDIVRVNDTLNQATGMLSNGGRFYVDVGSHLEYATPENISTEGVVLSELACERLVSESLRRLVASNMNIESAVVYKRVIDDNLGTWGYHINISEDRKVFSNNEMEYRTRPLTVHYAASLPLFGAGAVIERRGPEENRYVYSHSQKALVLTTDYSTGSTGMWKPIIHLRDEPLADIQTNRRMHIVGNDPHISPWAARIAIGTYSLLLAACREQRLVNIEPTDGAWKMAKRVALDVNCANTYDVVIDGRPKKMKAIDIEKIYIDAVKKTSELTAEQMMSLEEWERAVTIWDRDMMELRRMSDSIAKLSLIRAKLEREGKDHDAYNAESAKLDKDYTAVFRVTKEQAAEHDVLTLMAQTTPAKLRARWFAADMPPEGKIAYNVTHPPTTTRAYARGNAIRKGNVTYADWTSYTTGGKTTKLKPLEGTMPAEE